MRSQASLPLKAHRVCSGKELQTREFPREISFLFFWPDVWDVSYPAIDLCNCATCKDRWWEF